MNIYKTNAELIAWLKTKKHPEYTAGAKSCRDDNYNYDAIIDRLAELEAALTWQPIETAPRDGRMFLIAIPPECDDTEQAKFMWSYNLARASKCGKYFECGSLAQKLDRATHWRPLENPPQALQPKEAE